MRRKDERSARHKQGQEGVRYEGGDVREKDRNEMICGGQEAQQKAMGIVFFFQAEDGIRG